MSLEEGSGISNAERIPKSRELTPDQFAVLELEELDNGTRIRGPLSPKEMAELLIEFIRKLQDTITTSGRRIYTSDDRVPMRDDVSLGKYWPFDILQAGRELGYNGDLGDTAYVQLTAPFVKNNPRFPNVSARVFRTLTDPFSVIAATEMLSADDPNESLLRTITTFFTTDSIIEGKRVLDYRTIAVPISDQSDIRHLLTSRKKTDRRYGRQIKYHGPNS